MAAENFLVWREKSSPIRHPPVMNTGSYFYKFGDVFIPDGIPRIIDDEVFQKAQARLEANKRGGKGAIKKIHPEIAIDAE